MGCLTGWGLVDVRGAGKIGLNVADAEILFKPVLELAAMVRSGEVSSRELTELALRRAEALDPLLGAFTVIDADRALAAAGEVKSGDERPFAGVPTAIKDIGPFLAGYPFTAGAKLFGDFTPDIDGSVVRRLKDAGCVIVGKTKTPEMGIVPVTEPQRYGPACNPYDTSRTPGGSSGGAAAATAAGILPFAHGNDGGGSLRIPGACCGLIGLKPARNRVSGAPILAEHPLTQDMMLARSVADIAASLDVLAGPELGDANWAPPPVESFAAAAALEPGRLRVGFTVKPTLDLPVDPSHVEQVEQFAALLERLGHDVEPFDPPWDNPEMMLMFSKIFGGWISTLVRFAANVTGGEVTEDAVEPLTWELWQLAQKIDALDLDHNRRNRQRLRPGADHGNEPLRRDPFTDAQSASGADRHDRYDPGDGGVRQGGRVHVLHRRRERHRTAGGLVADGDRQRRPAAFGATDRATGRRGDIAVAGRASRARDRVARL